MILQAQEYEALENKPGRLQDFYDSTAGQQFRFWSDLVLLEQLALLASHTFATFSGPFIGNIWELL